MYIHCRNGTNSLSLREKIPKDISKCLTENIPKILQLNRQKVRKIAKQIWVKFVKKIFNRNTHSVIAGDVIAYIIGAGVLVAGIVWLAVQARAKWRASMTKEEKEQEAKEQQQEQNMEQELNEKANKPFLDQAKPDPFAELLKQEEKKVADTTSAKPTQISQDNTTKKQTIESKNETPENNNQSNINQTEQMLKKMPTINKNENINNNAQNNTTGLNKISDLLKQHPSSDIDDANEEKPNTALISKETINQQKQQKDKQNVMNFV